MRARRVPGLAALALAVALAHGCLGPVTTRAPRLYALDPTVEPSTAAKLDLSIGVGPVTLPKRLDRPQLVSRSTMHQVEIAEFEQWAEPLDKSFPRVLADDLSRAIPTDRVTVYPWSRSAEIDVQVEVDVSFFETESDGSVQLAARWRLIGPGREEIAPKRASFYREQPESDAAGARVDALGRALGAFSREVASEILRLR